MPSEICSVILLVRQALEQQCVQVRTLPSERNFSGKELR
ncbi:hypothetical protein SBA3_760024 [Candidatus Sulfopaludibacter sp. SbA3]|nr:hypothetical protein SBA3_760024 [Candidatus Sulfopaludibacter sp. SbA3]